MTNPASSGQRPSIGEQHVHFCFFLEGKDNKYYTLMMKTTSCLHFRKILWKLDKALGSSALDLTHQLNFQSATNNSGESLRQWTDLMLTLATSIFPSFHTSMLRLSPICVMGKRPKGRLVCFWWPAEAGRDGCQQDEILLQSWQRRSPKRQEAVRTMADKYGEVTDNRKETKA